MTDNKFIDAFKRMLTMTLAMIMVLGSVVPIATQEASAFGGKVGSKYTVTDGGQIRYGSGDGGYSNSRKCDLGDDLGLGASLGVSQFAHALALRVTAACRCRPVCRRPRTARGR